MSVTKQDVESWLEASRNDVRLLLSKGPKWWPTTNGSGQADATAWATAFFLRATLSVCQEEALTLSCSKGKEGATERVIKHHWGAREYTATQLMLDFAVYDTNHAMPMKVTGESEMKAVDAGWGGLIVGAGYMWDFFKLLLVPSTVRLYMGRLASYAGENPVERMASLAGAMAKAYADYAGRVIDPTDQFCGALISSAQMDHAETIIMWAESGILRFERKSKPFDGIFTNRRRG